MRSSLLKKPQMRGPRERSALYGAQATENDADAAFSADCYDTAIMIAIILAGGLGTRLRSALPHLPKPMAPVNDRPFLEYVMDYWMDQGCEEFILSVGYGSDAILRHFGSRRGSCPVAYAIENEPLGTGGALLAAARQMDPAKHPRVLVLNGDTLLAADLNALQNAHAVADAHATLTLLPATEENRYGRLTLDDERRVRSFTPDGTDGEWINGGLYLFDSQWLASEARGRTDACSLERELFPQWIRSGVRVAGCATDAPFLDIGLPESYARSAEFVSNLVKGV